MTSNPTRTSGETRICRSCGRSFGYQKRWANVWPDVSWCSQGCRRRGVSETDRLLEAAILTLLDHRSRDASICPSEAARMVAPDDWRRLMEPARRAARRLLAAGRVRIQQRGHDVDPDRARGPIRIRHG